MPRTRVGQPGRTLFFCSPLVNGAIGSPSMVKTSSNEITNGTVVLGSSRRCLCCMEAKAYPSERSTRRSSRLSGGRPVSFRSAGSMSAADVWPGGCLAVGGRGYWLAGVVVSAAGYQVLSWVGGVVALVLLPVLLWAGRRRVVRVCPWSAAAAGGVRGRGVLVWW